MTKRLLIVSNLDSSHPFGAFTRPFYLGKHLSRKFDTLQLGINCSLVDYAESISVGRRNLRTHYKAIIQAINSFNPDIIYGHENMPGLSSALACMTKSRKYASVVFDFHTLSSYEYWTRLPHSINKTKEFIGFLKTYIAQGFLVFSGRPIIVAEASTIELIDNWYKVKSRRFFQVGNGVSDDLIETPFGTFPDPYEKVRPAKIVVVIAPKSYQFPTNDMSVEMTNEIANLLVDQQNDLHFVIVGRDGESQFSNVTYAGFLPDRKDYIAYIDHADICLLPFPEWAVAGGARNKALDFFARNKIVVSTSEGLRGLENFRHEEHVLIASYSPKDLATMILDVVHNEIKYIKMAESAYRLAREKYSWYSMAERVAEIFEKKGSLN